MFTVINDKFNGVRVLQNNETGKFGVEDLIDQSENNVTRFTCRTLDRAVEIATMMSEENDRCDA